MSSKSLQTCDEILSSGVVQSSHGIYTVHFTVTQHIFCNNTMTFWLWDFGPGNTKTRARVGLYLNIRYCCRYYKCKFIVIRRMFATKTLYEPWTQWHKDGWFVKLYASISYIVFQFPKNLPIFKSSIKNLMGLISYTWWLMWTSISWIYLLILRAFHISTTICLTDVDKTISSILWDTTLIMA